MIFTAKNRNLCLWLRFVVSPVPRIWNITAKSSIRQWRYSFCRLRQTKLAHLSKFTLSYLSITSCPDKAVMGLCLDFPGLRIMAQQHKDLRNIGGTQVHKLCSCNDLKNCSDSCIQRRSTLIGLCASANLWLTKVTIGWQKRISTVVKEMVVARNKTHVCVHF